MTFLENVDTAKLQKILLIVISVLVLTALTLLLVIIILSINTTTPTVSRLEYTEIIVAEEDIKTGTLLLADAKHPYQADEAMLDLVGCTAYMEAQPDATGIGGELSEKNYIPWKAMKFNETAMSYAHKMLTDAKNDVKAYPVTIDAAYDMIVHGEASPEYATAMLMLLSDYSSTGDIRAPLSVAYRKWFNKNAANYGYIESFEDAYRFVGIPHAKYISEKGLSLSQYISYLKKETDYSRVLELKDDGNKYVVYYVECSAGNMIKVPASEEYTLSGTNEGGIIVTVKLNNN